MEVEESSCQVTQEKKAPVEVLEDALSSSNGGIGGGSGGIE